MRGWSLRRRLLLLTVTVTAAAWIAGGMGIFVVQQRTSDTLFDQRLRDIAGALLTFADHEIGELQAQGSDIIHVEGATTLGLRYKYQIWSNDGELLLVSVGTTRAAFAPFADLGFSDREVDGQPMRVLVEASDDGTKLLEVAEPLSARSATLDPSLALLLLPLCMSLALLIGLGAWAVRRTTRALSDSARQVMQRSPQDLRPLKVANPPQELTPILGAINELFSRIENAIASERRFTSAAAHELRTPLAAIKIQAQVARLMRDKSEQAEALERLLRSIDSASHMIDQLLTMSRIDGLIALKSQRVHVQLDAVALHVLDEIRPLVEKRRQTIVEHLREADIDGLEFGIAVLLRNLVDNAARYGPEGGIVRVSTYTEGDECFVCVEDQGPGIAPEQRERVFERFVRLAGDTDTDGCGIGLSIVDAVVKLHHAKIELGRSDLGGLKALVRFERTAPPEEPEPATLPPAPNATVRLPLTA